MHTLLILPVKAKVVGLSMIAIGATAALIASQNGLINIYRILYSEAVISDGSYPYTPDFWSLNLSLTYGATMLIAAGLISFVLAKEPDEFFYRARLEALHFALLAQLIIAILLYVFFHWMSSYQMENTYLMILTSSFIGFGVFFVLHYYYNIYTSRLKSEQY